MRKNLSISVFRGVVIVALGALVVWGVWTQLVTSGRPATVMAVTGVVLYSPAGNLQWMTARPGTSLNQGDQLMTQPDSAVTVQFNDGAIGFRLEAETLATLTARWNALLQAGSGGVYLSHGTLMAETREDIPTSQTRFCIDTEVAQVSLESTRTIVQALKDDPTIRVSSLRGDVRVRAKPAQAALYRADVQRLVGRETVVTTNETVIVHVEPPAVATPAPNSTLGRVVDAQTGSGVKGAVVQVVGDPALFALTDKDGYFEIQGAPFNSELILAGTTEEMAGKLELRPHVGRVSGRVVDVTTDQGIAGVWIAPVGQPALATETAPDGAFTIHELPSGVNSLTIVAEGYVTQVAEATVTTQVQVSLSDIPIVSVDALTPWAWLPAVFRQYP